MNCKVYVVLQSWANCMLIMICLDDLSTFEYFEVMIMFWSMNMICGVWINGATVSYGWELWKLWF
jgi:hypothetical protein